MIAIPLVFCLGILNFAVPQFWTSTTPMLMQIPWFFRALRGRLSLGVEFTRLPAALIMAAAGFVGWMITYAGCTAINGMSAGLIHTGRV